MICDNCKEELHNGCILTNNGNEIDYSECPNCGIVEVMGMQIEQDNDKFLQRIIEGEEESKEKT